MKMVLTPARNPDEYLDCLDRLGPWQAVRVRALRALVRETAPGLHEALRWGHLVYQLDSPVLLIRAEPARLLFGFWQGQRLRSLEPRLRAGGKYEMATLELRQDTPLARDTAAALVRAAMALRLGAG